MIARAHRTLKSEMRICVALSALTIMVYAVCVRLHAFAFVRLRKDVEGA